MGLPRQEQSKQYKSVPQIEWQSDIRNFEGGYPELSGQTYMYMYVCMCVDVCVYVCMCVYVCLYMYVCMCVNGIMEH